MTAATATTRFRAHLPHRRGDSGHSSFAIAVLLVVGAWLYHRP